MDQPLAYQPSELEDRASIALQMNAAVSALVAIASRPGGEHADTLTCLGAEALKTYDRLWTLAFQEKPQHGTLECAALLCRNLLELAIWTEYCASSPGRASTFRQDAARDVNGLRYALEQLVSLLEPAGMPPQTLQMATLTTAAQKASQRANITEEDTDYTKTFKAAKELSPAAASVFQAMNTTFSKLMHPTSFMIHMHVSLDDITEGTQTFAKTGRGFVMGIITQLKQSSDLLTKKPS